MPSLFATTAITFILSLLLSVVMQQLPGRIAILGGFLGLQLSYNPGVAFGVTLPSPWQEIVIIIALIVVMAVARKAVRRPVNGVAFGLIIGGALGNLVDRFLDGWVTDYVQIASLPIFNFADAAITIGAMVLILESLLEGRKKSG